MDEIDSYLSDELITREDFAAIIVKYSHKQIYIPSSSRYYKKEHSGHTYGLFQDVAWYDPHFDYIETAVLAGLMDGKENETGEYFDPEDLGTKNEVIDILNELDLK
jgi:iron complex transport system substrate-binding protein